MSKMVIPVMSERLIDFTTLAAGQQQELCLADRIDLRAWREVTLVLRIHSHTVSGSDTMTVWVRPQSWTPDDPGIVFLGGIAGLATISATTPSPGLLTAAVATTGTQPVGSLARVTINGTRSGASAMRATLSIAFAAKDA
jgi:hypothetical protein